MIIITRPKSNVSTYLYNTILKNKKWEKVTLKVQEDAQMLERLDSHGIEYIKLDGLAKASNPVDKILVKQMYDSLLYLDGILSTILSDEQIGSLDDDKLKMVTESIEKAKKMI